MRNPTDPRTRRAVLGAGLGAIAATAAAGLARPDQVLAADGDRVVLGEVNTASSVTTVRNDSQNGTALRGAATGLGGTAIKGVATGPEDAGGVGVSGTSINGVGVLGRSEHFRGVVGSTGGADSGVLGLSSEHGQGVFGWAAPIDVPTGRGHSESPFGSNVGVQGFSRTGIGVQANTESGTALRAVCESGFALKTVGRLKFDSSGIAVIAAGQTTVTVDAGVGIGPESFVLLTPMRNLGGRDLWFTKATTEQRFTIHLSSARSGATSIAWLLAG